ncbi:MAG: DUF1127 domain-containing protein [Paracoccaceae bacterium]
MLERIKSALRRHEALIEVERMSAHELDDLGMSRDEVAAFIRLPEDAAIRLETMAGIFGVAERALRARPSDHLSMLRTCAGCRDRAACGEALGRGELQRPSDCGFCPNAAQLEQHGIAA